MEINVPPTMVLVLRLKTSDNAMVFIFTQFDHVGLLGAMSKVAFGYYLD